MINFPADFFWGAATSAHQVEGDNIYNDWWEWEKTHVREVSGKACRHYELYKEDFHLAQTLNHNTHRLSIEWSRIEPAEGKFSSSELNHYKEVLRALRQRNLEPVVTLHHFTNPLWLSRLGGWQNPEVCRYFSRYVTHVTEALGDSVRFWITINEPMIYVYHAYIIGTWPPQKESFACARAVTRNLADAHIEAYRIIHAMYKSKRLSSPAVSIAKNLRVFLPCLPTLRNKLAVYLRDRNFNFSFLDRLTDAKALDFIGVNYYSRDLIEVDSWRLRSLLLDVCKKNHSTALKNYLGWDIYPRGLFDLLLRLKRYHLPVFVLENGICTDNDTTRWEFIREHLMSVHLAMRQGIKVLGYIYWSLLDNYEWDKGFAPRFGLIEVNYQTYQRTIRESARKFAEVCKTGRLY